jgi:hypothetical protein
MRAEDIRQLIVDYLTVNAPNGCVLAILSLSTVKDIVTIGLGIISAVCTILVTWHRLKTKPKPPGRPGSDED